MGMDYIYAGSASYPRFDRELCAVAKVFGGELTEEIMKRKENISGIDYWFGFLSSLPQGKTPSKFLFPSNTNKTLFKWFNNIYSDEFSLKETQEVWEEIRKHPEIQDISYQIWLELNTLCQFKEIWNIQ